MIVGVDRRIMSVGCIVIVAVLALFGGLMAVSHNHEQDTEPHYEVEMTDGTIYPCHSFYNKDNDITHLYHVDGIKGNTVKVMSHLIVRCTPI